ATSGCCTGRETCGIGEWLARAAARFFSAHFSGFMVMHFLFISEFFVRGMHASGPEPPVAQALRGVFVPLWPSFAALFISHGVSFLSNFLDRKSTRLNSSHQIISYAVFCLKK